MKRFMYLLGLCILGLSLCISAGAAVSKTGYEIEPPVSASYSKPYTLTVYIPNQMVVAYDAATLTPVRSMICSTGKNSGSTPKGTFTMPSTYTSGWDKWGNCYVRYPTRIKGSIYFHSILYNVPSKSLNTESWKKLGQPASHGCVRLTPLDAQWINYNCKKGTRIRIVNKEGEGLKLLHNQIRADLDKNGIASVQPTLKPTPTPPPPTLDATSAKSKAVKSLQSRLKSRGFYAGKITGKFSGATVVAWNNYQKAKGWEENSVATTEEQIELLNDTDTIGYFVNLSKSFEGIIVRKVEERLKNLGYFSGTPALKYDSSTASSVKKFQKTAGITPVNGKLPKTQQEFLFSEAAPTPTPKPDMTLGSKGSDVKKLQQRLYTLGFYAGSVTGKFQTSTRKAVLAYQEAAGIAETGTVSDALLQVILQDESHLGTARKLKLNAKGIVVRKLEEKLKMLGLYSGTPNTSFDSKTVKAVKKYQKSKGLKATGIVDGALFTMIMNETI